MRLIDLPESVPGHDVQNYQDVGLRSSDGTNSAAMDSGDGRVADGYTIFYNYRATA